MSREYHAARARAVQAGPQGAARYGRDPTPPFGATNPHTTDEAQKRKDSARRRAAIFRAALRRKDGR